jgi:serine/threonine-protein kinase
MTPERWREITAIFHAALARDATERAALVAARCGGDEELQREVESMLAAHGSAGTFGETPVFGTTSAIDNVALEAGARVGPYAVVSLLGVGGMGAVYRARDTNLQRDVALKVLLSTVADDPVRQARFSREARLLASLNHPNIAHVHGFEEADSVRALVMELVDGPTLAERIGRGPIPVGEALPIAKQIAEALEAAHARGIIHRDLKPTNVKVRSDGTVKVLDFGLAKLVESTIDGDRSDPLSTETWAGTVLGTPGYMAPEQTLGKPVDKRADLWAFGCVVFEMLTGQRAFAGDTRSRIVVHTLEHEVDWSTLPANTPSTLRTLLRRCLEKDPKQRLDSAAAARLEIDDALATPTPGATGAAVRAPRRARAWGMSLANATLAVALAGLGAGLFLSGRRSASLASTPRAIGRFVIVPPAATVVTTGAIALSPDGRHLVYGARSGNEWQLYLRALAHLESRALPGTSGGGLPTFSPDGQWIAFVADGKLKKVAVFGDGPPVTLGDLADCCAGAALTWLPDDRIVGGLMGDGIVAISARGGAPVFLTKPDTSREFDLHSPRRLPGGNWMLVGIHRGADTFDVAALHVQSGERRVLVENAFDARYVSTGHLVFARPGVLLAAPFDVVRLEVTGPAVPLVEGVLTINGDGAARYHLADDGSLAYIPAVSIEGRRLYWIDRFGNKEPLAIGTRGFIAPSLSPRGDRVALQIIEPTRRDIFVYDLVSGAMTRVTFDGTSAGPIWTPDGERLVFSSTKDGPRQLYWQPANGIGPPELLVADDHSLWAGSWSPDGRTLAYVRSSPTGQTDLALVRVGEKPTIAVANVAADQWPQISPDGRWLAYVSSDTGKFEVYVSPLDDLRGKRQLSTDGGASPRWSRDGRELFFRSGDRLMVVPVDMLPATTPRPTALPIQMRMADGTAAHPGYDISPDGRRLIVVERADEEAAPPRLFVVLNWLEELKQRVPTR